MDNLKDKLRKRISEIEANDHKLAEELAEARKNPKLQEEALEKSSSEGFESMDDGSTFETIVLRTGRPVLTIRKGEAIFRSDDVESEVWRERLQKSRQQIVSAIAAVGRIELQNHPSYEWVGTGWMVDENIVVTNRHVASIFGKSSGAGFVFTQGSGGKSVISSIDFLEEADSTKEAVFSVEKILHIEGDEGPDIALLRVKPATGKSLPKQILLSDTAPVDKQQVAVIGYPARDSRVTDQDLMIRIFGDVYNKKRLAPGQLMGISRNEILHDCSTLGGNSGSVVLDIKTGKAVGLHFAGRFLQNNSAVPAAIIKQRVDKFRGKSNGSLVNVSAGSKSKQEISNQVSSLSLFDSAKGTVSIKIPLEISITVGAPLINSTSYNKEMSAQIDGMPADFKVEDEVLASDVTNGDYKD
jgi:endonuclease G